VQEKRAIDAQEMTARARHARSTINGYSVRKGAAARVEARLKRAKEI
jgi:hypothetical protein